jgi:hypothetical protein
MKSTIFKQPNVSSLSENPQKAGCENNKGSTKGGTFYEKLIKLMS